jgi:predicted RNase H-like nuclease (RuvC/YqgF family)
MENQQKINELSRQIRELRSEKIMLDTKCYFAKESISNKWSLDESNEINDLKNRINVINNQLEPLVLEFNALHHTYYVQYRCKMIDMFSNIEKEYISEIHLLSQIDCKIDTLKNGFNYNLKNYTDLIIDLGSKIYDLGYSEFIFRVIIQKT